MLLSSILFSIIGILPGIGYDFLPHKDFDATRAGAFTVEPPTLVCAGFEWEIYGDDNRNATVTVSYRKLGEESWKEALPLLRIGGEKIFGHGQRWV